MSHPRDHTTLVVRLGLLLLLVIGVASVFGDSLMGLFAPPVENGLGGGAELPSTSSTPP